MFLRLKLLIFFPSICCAFVIDRLNDGSGDAFQKSIVLPGMSDIRISDCSAQTHGRGSATYLNHTACKCSWGQTFFVDTDRNPAEAKCILQYGRDDDDTNCRFWISGSFNVKLLNPADLTDNFLVGNLKYGNKPSTSNQIEEIRFWNITWQLPTERNLFHVASHELKWSATNSVKLAEKYKGLLFKLKIIGYTNKWKESCLLLKISGSRNYPLPVPHPSPSSSSLSSSKTSVHSSSLTTQTTPKLTSSQVSRNSHSTASLKILSSSKTRQMFLSIKSTTSLKITSTTVISSHLTSSNPASVSSSLSFVSKYSTIPTTRTTKTPSFVPPSSVVTPSFTQIIIQKTSVPSVISTRTSNLLPSGGAFKTNSVASSKSTPKITKLSSTNVIPPTKVNPNSKTGKQTSDASNAPLIAGITVGIITAIVAFAVIFLMFRRKKLSKTDRDKRRETLTLNLTAHSYYNNTQYRPESNGGLGHTKPNVGNPVYEKNIKLSSAGGEKTQKGREYENAETLQQNARCDPIYNEVDPDGPLYQETTEVYMSLDNPASPLSIHYQPLDKSTLPKIPAQGYANPVVDPVEPPIYRVLDEQSGYQDQVESKSPLYQVVEQEQEQPPIEEPFYREIESEDLKNGRQRYNYNHEDDFAI